MVFESMIIITVQSVFRIEMQIFFYLKKIILNINIKIH
jgi:hypothetical protein